MQPTYRPPGLATLVTLSPEWEDLTEEQRNYQRGRQRAALEAIGYETLVGKPELATLAAQRQLLMNALNKIIIYESPVTPGRDDIGRYMDTVEFLKRCAREALALIKQ